MSTTRLFDQDAYLGEFEATVERSVCEGGMYRVLLDQTAFFPEGGGQPADEGTLDGIFVTDVQEIDGEIWHTVEAPLEPGKTVVGKLDFEKRFSNMQNHCGEHIVSGIVHRIYGFNNVGFHMGSDVITVDCDDRRLRQMCVLRNPRCKNRGNPSDQNLKCPEIQRRRPRDHAFR